MPANATPVFDSAPTAGPNPAGVGQSIAFAAAVHDPEGIVPLVTWYFGDGASETGATAAHYYTAPGTYDVSVTVSDGETFAFATLSVQVNAALIGFGADTDGDGFSDATEAATGANGSDPASNVFGKPAALNNLSALAVGKVHIKLNFAKQNADSISATGTLTLPVGFNASTTPVLVDVGGVSKKFALSAKGSAKQGSDSFKLAVKKEKASAKFTASFAKGAFGATLDATSGLSNADLVTQRTVMVTVAVAESIQQAAVGVKYKAKRGKMGTAGN